MTARLTILALLLTGLVSLVERPVADAQVGAAQENGYISVPVIPTDDGDAVERLLCVRPFTLDNPYRSYWRKDRPVVREGTLLVVEVDPEYAYPRQVGHPILYCGDMPVELTNVGYRSGRLIGIVPGHVDLTKTPLYFGSTELPDQVTPERGAAELAAAGEIGVEPFTAIEVAQAREAGGELREIFDLDFLYLEASELIFTYSPVEEEVARIHRLAAESR